MKHSRSLVCAVLACAIAVAVVMGVHARAGLTNDQVRALLVKIDAGDKGALKTLVTEAQKGNRYAQFNLGVLYHNGQDVSQNYTQAAQWYRKAAEQGYPPAQYSLGVDYASGQGVRQDYDQAGQWWRKAAEQGYSPAQYNLGVAYEHGLGVAQDYTQAAQWYRRAVQQGLAPAQTNLGHLYATGHGVPQDYVQATQWYRKAAQQGNALGQNNLGVAYEKGQGVPRSKVVAYALWSLSIKQDVPDSNIAAQNLSILSAFSKDMSSQEIETAKTLAQKMSIQGNLLKALDEYMTMSSGH